MYRFKGFGGFPPLANNERNVVNGFGELSVYGETYASDRGIFKDLAQPNSLLFSFLSIQELSATTYEEVPVPPSVSALILVIMEDLYNKSVVGELVNDVPTLTEYLLNQYAGQIQNVVVGTIRSDGNYWFPDDIYFEGTSQTNSYSARIWFSDDAFRRQYDEYEIRVVPPVANIDQFFGSATDVQVIADSLTLNAVMIRAQEIANGQPATFIHTEEFEWVDPLDPENRIVIPWTVVIYGGAGMNIDAIKRALAKWILENSQYPEDQWNKLFPDIFGSTEFVVIPVYSHVAIPQNQVNAGVYSATNNPNVLYKLANLLVKGVGYTEEYIGETLNVVQGNYKAVQLIIVGGYRNRDDMFQFGNRWPKYIPVGTNSLDFERMGADTMRMALLLNNMLRVAETMTAFSDIPIGYTRTVRDGVLYLTATIDRTLLIVASKQSVLEFLPEHTGIVELDSFPPVGE